MKKITSVLTAVFAVSIFLSAQPVDVSWGKAFDSETFISRIVGKDEKSHYVLAWRKEQLYFERYSSSGDMKQELSKKVELPKRNGSEQDFEALYQLQDNFLLLVSYYDKDADMFIATAYPMSKDGVVNTAGSVEVFNAEANKKSERGDFNFVLSPDKMKLLVYHNVSLRKKNLLKSAFKVFNGKLEILNEGSEEVPLKGDDKGRQSLSNYIVTNEGAVFMLLSKTTPPDYLQEFTIWAYEKKGSQKKDIPVDLNNKKAYSMVFAANENNELLVTGYYVQKNKKGLFSYEGLAGVFYARINISERKIVAENMMEFDRDTRAMYYEDKQLDKGAMMPNDFVPREIVFDDKGGLIFVAERYSVSYSQGRGTSSTVYYYGDIMLSAVSPEGKMKWVKIIPKIQYYINTKVGLGVGGAISAVVWIPTSSDKTIYLSYFLTVKDGKIYFVFNEEPKSASNTDPKKSVPTRRVEKAIPVKATIDGASGALTKEPLLEAKDFDVTLRPKIYYETAPGEVIIYGSKKDVDKFGIMKF